MRLKRPLPPRATTLPLEQRLTLARQTETPPDTLISLTRDPALEVRRALALNPYTPPATLKSLVRDSDSAVRLYVRVRLGAQDWRKARSRSR